MKKVIWGIFIGAEIILIVIYDVLGKTDALAYLTMFVNGAIVGFLFCDLIRDWLEERIA